MGEADRERPAPASIEMWRVAVERAIGRGTDTLGSRTAEGLTIEPLYARRIEDPAQPWRSGRSWSVAQRIDHPAVEMARDLALRDLEGGADALVLVGAQSPYARGFGVDDPSAMAFLLEGIELDRIAIRLDAGAGTLQALDALADIVDQRHLASAGLDVDIGFDPLGWRARLGTACEIDPERIIDRRTEARLAGTMYLADGRPYHEAGAGEAQELAAVLATAVAYLRQAESLGVTLDLARRSIALLLAADVDLFVGLAKFRAIRRLWALIETACALEPAPVRLHAETSWRTMTRYDPWTNAMRATAATFAAGLGGADCMTVLPFTLGLGLPNEAARRLARNTQRVLLDESSLGMVADPAAGAGGFEALTETLCVDAWRLFQDIERDGGLEAEPARDRLKARIAETARQRAGRIADLAHGIIGTSRFASLAVPPAETLNVRPRQTHDVHPDALPVLRDAAPFEAIRDRVETAAAQGARPHVFLATHGAPAVFGPHTTFAVNFFAAAGIRAEAPLAERDIETQVADFTASGTPVVCVCRPGDSGEAADLVARLREAGARYILATGGAAAAAPAAGIDALIHEGCPALAILGKVGDLLLEEKARALT